MKGKRKKKKEEEKKPYRGYFFVPEINEVHFTSFRLCVGLTDFFQETVFQMKEFMVFKHKRILFFILLPHLVSFNTMIKFHIVSNQQASTSSRPFLLPIVHT